jgi:carbon storage regulator
MLVLSRKINESIIIDGVIEVKVIKIDGDVAKIGIIAPANVPIHRQEIYQEIQNSNQQAVIKRKTAKPSLPKIQNNPSNKNSGKIKV